MKFKFHKENQAPPTTELEHYHMQIMVEDTTRGPKGEILIGHKCATESELNGQIDIAIEQLQNLRKSEKIKLGR